MGYKISSRKELEEANLPEEVKEQLRKELIPENVPGKGSFMWRHHQHPLAEYQQREVEVCRQLYMELHRPAPDLDKLRKIIKERFVELCQS